MKKNILFLCFCLMGLPHFAQTLNNGPIQLRVRVRDWDVTLPQPNDLTLNTSFVNLGAVSEDEYTFKIWARGSAVNTNWYGGNCQLDEFDPSILNSMDYNDIFYDQIFPTASVPQYFDLRINCHEDDMYDFSYYLSWAGGLSPCSNLTNFPRCNFDVNACCAQVPIFGCLLTESDDLNCNANTYASNIDYQAYPPCQWHDYGYVQGGGCSPNDNVYKPHVESFWRYTNGTGLGAAIDLGTLTPSTPLFHFNSNECYTNNWAMSNGNDVFYQFTINQPMGITASLCGTANFNTVMYLLDNTGAVLDSNDNFCNLTSRLSLPLCAAGTYYVVVDAPTPADMGTFTLNIQETPNLLLKVNAGPDILVCSGNNITLGGVAGNPSAQYGTPPYTYSWYPSTGLNAANVANPILTPSISANYILFTTDSKGCTISDTANLTLGIIPTAGISASTNLICTGGSATFTGTGGVSYQWLVNGNAITGATSNTYSGAYAGGYNVVAFSVDGCPDTSSTEFLQVVNSAVANATSVGSNQICAGQVATLAASGLGLSYQWLNNGQAISGATNSTYQTNAAGNYQVVLSFNGQCADTSLAVPINVVPPPSAILSPSGTQAICEGGALPVTVAGNGTYQWYYNGQGTTNTSNIFNATQAGTYYVVVAGANNCTAQSAPFILNYLPQPIAAASAAGATTVCQGNTVTLVGSGTGGGQSYQWLSNGVPISGATQNLYTTSIAGNYQLVITENTCDDTSNVVGVTIAFPPLVSVSPSGAQTICGGSNLALNASGAGSYQWYYNSQPIVGATLPTYSATQAGVYYLVAGNNSGCTTTSPPTTLTFLPAATAQINPTGTLQICQGEDVTLLAGGGTVTGWLMNGLLMPNTAQSSLTVTTTGAYQAVISGACNTDTSSMTVIGVNPLPTPTITPSGNVTVCEGKEVTLNAGGGNTYQWLLNGQPIVGSISPTLLTNQAGIYYATVTNSVNCSANTPIVTLEYSPNPQAALTALKSTIFCEGQNTVLKATGGSSYQWFVNGAVLPNYSQDSLSVSQSGQYLIIASNACGSDSSLFIYIEVVPKPIANFNILEEKIYPNTEIHFVDSSKYAGNWLWSYGDNTGTFSTQNPTHSYEKIGDYPVVLIVSDGILGCSDTMYYTLSVIPLPKVFIPNVFSPNKDGNYDELVVEYGELAEIELKIFDRWGAIAFQTTNKNIHWDGRNQQGSELPRDVYYYQLTGKNQSGQKLYYKGNVTLMR